MEAVLERVSRLEADRALVGSLSTEVARLRELQSLFSNEVVKVREQLREAKESADKAKDIGLASRAVVEEAEKKAEAHLGRVGRLEAELLALRSAPVPAETKPAATAPTFPPSIVLSASVEPAAPTSPLPSPPSGSVPQAVVSIASAPAPTSPPSAVVPTLEELEIEILALRAAHGGWNSAIVPDFPKLFGDFKKKRFTHLSRGSRDGFRAHDFHGLCDGHANTLTVIFDTDGNILGGFTPVEWESSEKHWLRDGEAFCRADPSLERFIFRLKDPHNFPPRRFPLKEEKKEEVIRCDSNRGPILVT
jgi:hypothetical protein